MNSIIRDATRPTTNDSYPVSKMPLHAFPRLCRSDVLMDYDRTVVVASSRRIHFLQYKKRALGSVQPLIFCVLYGT